MTNSHVWWAISHFPGHIQSPRRSQAKSPLQAMVTTAIRRRSDSTGSSRFQRWGVPKTGWFIRENPIHMIWGYPHFRNLHLPFGTREIDPWIPADLCCFVGFRRVAHKCLVPSTILGEFTIMSLHICTPGRVWNAARIRHFSQLHPFAWKHVNACRDYSNSHIWRTCSSICRWWHALKSAPLSIAVYSSSSLDNMRVNRKSRYISMTITSYSVQNWNKACPQWEFHK